MPTIAPSLEQTLAFCAGDPVERVFLEDVARRGVGRFLGVGGEGGLRALCHLGANVVPSGNGCGVFAEAVARARPSMIIGEERAVSELWEAVSGSFGALREDRPGQPVFELRERPASGRSALRPATLGDLDRLVPACAAAYREELGVDPLLRDGAAFRRRTRQQIEEGRSWLWLEDDTVCFKAEASAWTPSAVQLQQVWVDPEARRLGFARRGLQDLFRLLLDRVPIVCLFVRAENAAAIGLYEAVGMRRTLSYRSVLLGG